ncbi:MAG: DsrH/TusB family sulfur relay protein [Nitrospirota bacterium]|nr:DsrH/TusB family sulfur relay protein [Nitrospirota bacterium]
MRKILYLVKEATPVGSDLFPSYPPTDTEVSVVLIQDGVTLTHLQTERVYVLSDDVLARNITSSYPVVSYADVLRMMFEADTVIAL